MKNKKSYSIFDRVAVGYLSVIISFITGLIIWAIFHGLNVYGLPIYNFPFSVVVWFTLTMLILSMLGMENIVINIYEKLWKFIVATFGNDKY